MPDLKQASDLANYLAKRGSVDYRDVEISETIRWLVGEVERLESILEDCYWDEDCSFDHHGYCQAHDWMRVEPKCPNARAREYFKELEEGSV